MAKATRRFSLGKKIYFFVGLTVFLASMSVAVVSHFINASRIDSYFKDLTLDNARNFASMVDVNFLKRINDSLGHSMGDSYLKGCCQIVCDTYKHSPVYRIGGDEFVVLLTGSDYEHRNERLERIRKTFKDSYENTASEMCNRYSAAVGMAEYAADDNTIELVFKRADKRMYEDKQRIKMEMGQ